MIGCAQAEVSFGEAVAIFEAGAFLPESAGQTATDIESLAVQLDKSPNLVDRASTLREVGAAFENTEQLWSLRTSDVTSSAPGDAAYMVATTEDIWGAFFATFFEGPTADAEGAAVAADLVAKLREANGY